MSILWPWSSAPLPTTVPNLSTSTSTSTSAIGGQWPQATVTVSPVYTTVSNQYYIAPYYIAPYGSATGFNATHYNTIPMPVDCEPICSLEDEDDIKKD